MTTIAPTYVFPFHRYPFAAPQRRSLVWQYRVQTRLDGEEGPPVRLQRLPDVLPDGYPAQRPPGAGARRLPPPLSHHPQQQPLRQAGSGRSQRLMRGQPFRFTSQQPLWTKGGERALIVSLSDRRGFDANGKRSLFKPASTGRRDAVFAPEAKELRVRVFSDGIVRYTGGGVMLPYVSLPTDDRARFILLNNPAYQENVSRS